MNEEGAESRPWRCLFCHMQADVKLFGVPVCGICRDQLQDFVLASGIQGALVVAGLLGGLQFLIEEVLLFAVLVLIKHRMPSMFDRFLRRR